MPAGHHRTANARYRECDSSRVERGAVDDVAGADEAFFTGTAIEVTPITEVDGRSVGDGQPGPITVRIQQSYFDAVHGRLPQ